MNARLKELCVDIQLKRKTELFEKSSNFTILRIETYESGLTPPSINIRQVSCTSVSKLQDFEQRQYVGVIYI